MGDEAEQYSRRVEDLIAVVQQTISDVDDFLKGRMKVPPHEYQKVKRDLMSRQSAALAAMNQAIAGQQELLGKMDATGEPLPRRRASDYAPGEQRERPRMATAEDREIDDIKRRAGLDEDEWRGQGMPGHSDYMIFDKPAQSNDDLLARIAKLAATSGENAFKAAQQIIALAKKVQ